jgi:hypothetical protein
MNGGTDILSTEEVLRAEAKEIHGFEVPASRDGKPLAGKGLYRELNRLNSAALCLSGGGIRSAAFALGVIQALAVHPRSENGEKVAAPEASLLAKFHYLSTVSGGGYVGSWLSALRARAPDGFAEVWRILADRRTSPEQEPREIAWLRRYSNYLTPKLGLMSADSWTAVAISLRNLLLNWLVVLPILCLLLLVLKLITVGLAWLGKYPPVDPSSGTLVGVLFFIGIFCAGLSLFFTARHRPTRGRSRVDQARFLRRDLFPALLSGVLFTMALAVPWAHVQVHDLPVFSRSQTSLALLGGLVGVGTYAASWLLAWPRFNRKAERAGDFVAWIVAGAVYGVLLAVAIYIHGETYGVGFWEFDTSEVVLLIFGVPWVLFAQLIAEMIFVGLSSWEERSDSDREWLGRAAGWFLVTAFGWIVVMFLALVAAQAISHFYTQISESLYKKLGALLPTLLSGAATALLGKSSRTPGTGAAKDWTGLLMNVGLAIAGVIFVGTIVVATSALLDGILLGGPLLETKSVHGPVSADALPPWPEPATSLLQGLVAAAIIGFIASIFVNINRFSLHALYRNRLIRAFLGASNPKRDRDLFTDFDEADNRPMHELWSADRSRGWQPFHVVNMALNIVSTNNLAWQERKAESFTVSPLHSGTACKEPGYRLSREYGDRQHGISVGTAVAISGAAASPNMGYHSSPAVTLLMALFNVRLGWWLGNPGAEGKKTYRKEGPGFAIRPLLAETFGLTTDDKPYVYLSDGGHFENLGLYEIVRRRCRLIVVSDAGCDSDFKFEDLGNAVRKIKLDLGVTIRFHGIDKLKTRPKDGGDVDLRTPYHAVGEIDYPAADRESGEQTVEKGFILYIKPACHGTEEADIRSYAAEHPDFPHQSTAEQWFSESQFESYRALGFEIVDGLLSDALVGLQPPLTLDRILQVILDPTVKGAPKIRWALRQAAAEAAAAETIARAGA